jgi:peptide chain release factor 1
MDADLLDKYKSRYKRVKNPQTPAQWEEFNRLQPIINEINVLEELQSRLTQSQEIMKNSDDQMKKLAEEDIENIKIKIKKVEKKIQDLRKNETAKPDITDSRNAIIEIRAGAGGEESSLFASDLFRMYSSYAKNKKLEATILDRSLSSTGGIKEIIFKVSGKNAFGTFRFESGVHRVQRVPETESSGRIHTSTATVAVLPEAEEVDVEIKPEDIRIETLRASGPGGQFVNKTETAVRIVHEPTGIIVRCQESKSQQKNRELAMSILRSRLHQHQLQKTAEERGDMRQKQIGSAMRAEKIRTYNFPQSRITDHRLKKSWHNLETILDGDLDNIINSFKDYKADEG